MQHLSRPQLPRSRLSVSGMSWAFAIFTEIGSNLRRCDEQQSWRPQGPMPSSSLVVSRAPICRISIRAWNSRARSRTRSRKSTRSSELKKTVTRRRDASIDAVALERRDRPLGPTHLAQDGRPAGLHEHEVADVQVGIGGLVVVGE